MQKYILVYAEPPAGETPGNTRILIENFAERAKGIEMPDGVDWLLPKGPVWLLKQETAEKVLGSLFALADKASMDLRLRYLTED